MSVSRELLGPAGGKSAEDAAWPLLAAALEETGDGLIIVRAAGDATRIVFCNRAFTDLTGFAAGEPLRQAPFFLCDEPLRGRLDRALAEALTKGEPRRDVALGNRKSGGAFFARVVMRPLTMPGAVRYAAITFVDVSEQAEIDAAVRQLPTAVVVLSPDMVIRYVNEAAAQVRGLAIAQLVGHSWYEVMPGLEQRREYYARALAGEALDFQGVPFRLADGTMRFVDTHLRPLRDASGVVSGMLVLAEDVTAQHQTMTHLQASEQWLRTITENSHDIIVVLAADGRIKSLAGNFRQVFGVAAEERVGRSALDFVHPEDLPRIARNLESLAATPGERARDEFRLRREDGTTRWVDTIGVNMLDDPAVQGIVLNMRDSTERRKAEVALADAHKHLDLAVASAGLALWDCDVATRTLTWNDEWYRILEVDPAVGRRTSERMEDGVHPDDVAGYMHSLEECWRGPDDHWERQIRVRAANGEWKWIFDRGRVVERDASGRALRMAGVSIDIDGAKRAEIALKDSEARLAATLWGSQVGFWEMHTANDEIVWWNDWCASVDIDPCSGRNHSARWDRLIHPDDPAALDSYRGLLEGHTDTYEAEYRMRTLSGGWRWILSRGRAVERDAGGRAKRVVGVTIDIDARKRMETALRASEAQLETAIVSADLGLWDWNVVTDRCVWLSNWCERFGFEACDGDGHLANWLALIHKDDLPSAMAAFDGHMTGPKDFYETEYRMHTRAGEWRWVHERGQVVARDVNGRATRVVGVCFDADARRRTEQSLRETQARFELTVWGSQVGFWDWNLETEDTRWLNDWCRTVDLDPCDGPDHVARWDSRIHPDDCEKAQYRFAAALSGASEFYEAEYRVLTLSGEWHWIHERGRVVKRAADGRALRMAGICMDIDARKRMELTLRETEARLDTALWSGSIAYWDWDLTHDMDRKSEQWFAMTGYSRAGWEEEQDPWRRRVHPGDLPRLDAALHAYVSGQTANYEVEYRLRVASGDWKWLLDRGRIIERDAEGTPTKMSGTSIDIDARKRAEHELERSEYRYRTVAALSPGFIQELVAIGDDRLRFEWASEGFEQIFGLKYSDLDPVHGWRERCHPDDRATIDQGRQALLEGRRTEAEFRVIDAGNQIRWLHGVAQPFTDPATGKVSSVIGVCDDITARKYAELALQKSESILRSVIDNVPDWLLLVDLDLNCRFANREFLGRLPAQLVGRSVLELAPPAERETLAKALALAATSSNLISSEFSIAVDGERRHFEMRAAPALEQGAVTGLTVALTEITERKLAEATLRTQASILETMREGVAVIARDGSLRLTNPAFDRMFGYARGEIAGMPVATFLGDVEFAVSERDRVDFLERNRRQPLKRDLLLRRQDGTVFTGEAVITSLELGAERVWLAVVQDITERKELEHEIIESANREQQRIGSDLHDGLGQELTGAALMLRGLTGKMKKSASELTPYVDEIVALVNHTIESARALARGLSPVNIDRGGLVGALQDLVTRASEMYGVEVRLRSRVSPRLTLDEAACNHLYRIAQEAVTNAVRHGQASRIVVQLLVEERNVRLTISDNGTGLPQNPADEPRRGASGMGLKIMAYRARMIGGEVTIERLREGGTRVRCRCRQPAPKAPAERRSS